MPTFPSVHIWTLREHAHRIQGDVAFPSSDSASGIWDLMEQKAIYNSGLGGGSSVNGTTYATSYLSETGGTLYELSAGGSINATLDLMSDGDALLLSGTTPYTVTALTAESYSSSPFRNKNVLICGATDASEVKLEITHAAQRGLHFFCENSNITNTIYQQYAFLHLFRVKTSSTSYINALSGGVSGSVAKGRAVNCYVNLNGSSVSWIYDNSNSAATDVNWTRCTFGNYASWVNKYTGNPLGNDVTDCIFSGTYDTDDATFYGTNTPSVLVDPTTGGYDSTTYTTSGHLIVPADLAVEL